jgi:predicted permease
MHPLALALGRLRRRPVFSVLAVTTLTVAVAAVSATFGLLNSVLLRPLPFADSEALVAVRSVASGAGRAPQIGPGVSHANYVDIERGAHTVSTMGAYTMENPTLSADGADPVVLTSAAVTATLTEVLRVRPVLGRAIAPDDDRPGAPAVAVLGHDLWSSRFGADSAIVGTTIVLDGLAHRVVGVLPRGFAFPLTAQLWTAVGSLPGVVFRAQHGLQVVARLASGTPVEAAQSEMRQLMAGLAVTFPRENAGRSLEVIPLRTALVGSADRPVRLLWLATMAVWLLACVNIAWLLLARTIGERQELAIRRALGATAARLTLPWVYESIIIVVTSALAGSALALWCSRWLASALGTAGSVGQPVLDARVLGATLACAAMTMLVLIAIPAFVATRTTPSSVVRREATGAVRAGLGTTATSAVIAGQVAGAVVLSWAAIVLMRGLDRATRVDLGFTPQQLFVAGLRLPPYAYRDDARVRTFYANVLADARRVPGVTSAAVALAHPLQAGFSAPFQVADDVTGTERRARLRSVSEGYFRTVGTRVLAGRDVGAEDRADGARVVLVNEAFAREFLPGRSPVGQRLIRRTFGAPAPVTYEIIGVTGNERFSGPHGAPEPAMYVPFEQMPFASANLIVRTGAPVSDAFVRGLRSIVWRHERGVPFDGLRSMEDVAGEFLATPRTLSRVLIAFAGVAGLLMMIGIHGILAQTVTQRRRDLAIRRALGATRGGVIRNVVGRSAAACAVGSVIGASLVMLSGAALRPFTFDVPAADPLVVLSTLFLLVAAATLGALVPALRAARLSPAAAMRE